MGRRPQPNPLRGILRAAAVAIVLIIFVVAALLIASSFGAPAVHAPTIVPSPARNLLTPSPTKAKKTATSPAHATPSPTKKKGASLGRSPTFGSGPVAPQERAGGKVVARVLQARPSRIESASPSPDGRRLAYFLWIGGATARNPLFISDRATGHRKQVGYGDPLVRPVWSPTGRYLLYVRVRQAAGIPGARWSLLRLDTPTGRTRIVTGAAALSPTPLGWSMSRIIFLLADSTDTSIFTVSAGHPKLVGIMMPQPIVSANLSPGGRFIAFGAPTNCSSCSVYLYDLSKHALSSGPTGMPNDTTLAWTADGSTVVAILGNRLTALSAATLGATSFPIPSGLPRSWNEPMRAVLHGNMLTLIDLVTHRAFHSFR